MKSSSYRISEILYNAVNYRCISFKSLSSKPYVFVVCKDDVSGNEIATIAPDTESITKELFLDHLKNQYEIKTVSGVGEDFIYAFDKHELELLGYIDFIEYTNESDESSISHESDCILHTSLSYNFTTLGVKAVLIELDDSLHMSFSYKFKTLSIADVLLELHDCYEICDDILKIYTFNNGALNYKISDTSKFNNLLTKLIVLRRK